MRWTTFQVNYQPGNSWCPWPTSAPITGLQNDTLRSGTCWELAEAACPRCSDARWEGCEQCSQVCPAHRCSAPDVQCLASLLKLISVPPRANPSCSTTASTVLENRLLREVLNFGNPASTSLWQSQPETPTLYKKPLKGRHSISMLKIHQLRLLYQ